MEAIHYYQAGELRTTVMRRGMRIVGRADAIQLVIGIQDLLDNANISDPAQIDAYQMFRFVLSRTPVSGLSTGQESRAGSHAIGMIEWRMTKG